MNVTRVPEHPDDVDLGGPDTPGADYLLLVDDRQVGGSYWGDALPGPGYWCSWGPAGLSTGHASRDAAEAVQVAAHVRDREDPAGVALRAAIGDLHDRLARLASDCHSLGYEIEDAEYPIWAAPEPRLHRSPKRPPRMTGWAWQKDQGVELGAVDRRHWYWRVRTPGEGSVWAGPYWSVEDAKRDALDYDYRLWRERKALAA